MFPPIMPEGSRTRQLNAVKRFTNRTAVLTQEHRHASRPEWSYTNVIERSGHGKSVLVEDESTAMTDMVIPNFKARSSNGEIFNNPMIKTTSSLINPLIRLDLHRPNFQYGDYRRYDNILFDVQTSFPNFELSEQDASSAYDNAIVDAYAGITANKNNTALWLGELKETISMLFDIGKGAKALFEMTKAQRKKWKEGKLSVEGQQQLTLQILYGVLPLEQQIAQFLDGLFEVGVQNERITSRGYRPYTKTSKKVEKQQLLNTEYDFYFTQDRQIDESIEMTIRAGCLFEIDLSDTSFLGIILDPKQVVSTAYALARLSFVLDWFINVGGTLAAWAPSSGTNILASFVSVETTHELSVTSVYSPANGTVGTGNSVTATKSIHSKWRKPVDRGDLAVIPRVDINLDISKILSMVLLFAKVKKTI